MSYLGIILTFVFVNNIVLSQLLGLCPIIGVTRHRRSTLGLGIAVTVVSALSTLFAWIADRLVLEPAGAGFLRIIVTVLAAAGTAQLLDWVLAKVSKKLYQSVGMFLPLVVANCAVVGVALITLQGDYGPFQSFVAGASGGAGAMLAMLLLASLRERVESGWIPEALQGMPITLITAGLVAMTFLAFDKAFLVKLVG